MSAQEKPQIPNIKVVLLGRSYSGKTSLVNRYIYGKFTIQDNTVGMAFAYKEVTVDGKTFRLGIWDTAGSERYQAITPMYYRGATVALLCYDTSDLSSFERLSFWYDQVQMQEPGCMMFIVGTKIDTLVDTDLPLLKQKEAEFAEQKGLEEEDFFRTSSKTGEGVEELFQSVAEYCAGLSATEADPTVSVKDTVPVGEDDGQGTDKDKAKERRGCCTIQ